VCCAGDATQRCVDQQWVLIPMPQMCVALPRITSAALPAGHALRLRKSGSAACSGGCLGNGWDWARQLARA
jgi:hypothetical protein